MCSLQLDLNFVPTNYNFRVDIFIILGVSSNSFSNPSMNAPHKPRSDEIAIIRWLGLESSVFNSAVSKKAWAPRPYTLAGFNSLSARAYLEADTMHCLCNFLDIGYGFQLDSDIF